MSSHTVNIVQFSKLWNAEFKKKWVLWWITVAVFDWAVTVQNMMLQNKRHAIQPPSSNYNFLYIHFCWNIEVSFCCFGFVVCGCTRRTLYWTALWIYVYICVSNVPICKYYIKPAIYFLSMLLEYGVFVIGSIRGLSRITSSMILVVLFFIILMYVDFFQIGD